MDDIEAIKRLKARYCRLLDTKDWSGLREVFTDDVVMDTAGSGGEAWTGAEAFLAFLRPALADAITVHHCHTPEIELTGPDSATGVWAMEDKLWWPDGRTLRGYGHYHETYARQDGSWRIATCRLTRLHLEYVEGPSPA